MAGLDGIKTWWGGLSSRNKWLVGGGAALVGLLMVGEAGGAGQQINADAGRAFTGYGQGYPNPYAQQQGGQGGYGQQGGYAQQGGGDYGQQANYGGGYGYGGGGGQAYGYGGGGGANSGGGADPDPTGYWANQRAQEQTNQNFDNYIRDQTVVRDNDSGQVYTEVPNQVGDAAVASGAYSQVPTSELPTSSDSSSGE